MATHTPRTPFPQNPYRVFCTSRTPQRGSESLLAHFTMAKRLESARTGKVSLPNGWLRGYYQIVLDHSAN